jgi:parvulin-like peptidyl-prolyl isomerase
MAFPSLPGSFFGSSARRLALVATVSLLAAGCHPRVTDPNDPKFILAEKGDWTITNAELTNELNGYFQQRQITPEQVGPTRMPVLKTAMLKNMVLEKLILARAATMQLKDVDKEEADAFNRLKGRFPTEKDFNDQLKQAGLTVDDFKKRIHDQVLIHKVLEADALQNAEPSEQEVDDFYLQHKSMFNVPPKLRASRVLVIVDAKASPADKAAKKQTITKAHDRVAKGEDFSKVAMQVSEDRYSAPKGGDIGFFQRGENEAQFDDVAFASKVGALSPVFETPMGFQFIKVTDTRAGGPVSIAEARASIAEHLKQDKVAHQEQAYTEKLLKDSDVTYHMTLVDPPPMPAGASAPQDPNGGDGSAPQGAPAQTAPPAGQ